MIPSSRVPKSYKQEEVQDKTRQYMIELIESFNKRMGVCKSDDERLRLIVDTIQRINQLHPFLDGNIRTCYIVLNRLLDHYGLGKTIMINPNRLDMCSLDELVDCVKSGQKNYQRLVSYHKSEPFSFLTEGDVLEKLRSIACKAEPMFDVPAKLMEEFDKHVIRGLDFPSATLSLASSSVFKGKPDYCKHPSINKAIQQGAYGLAIRRACFGGSAKLINNILNDFGSKIDFSQTTSKGMKGADLLKRNSVINQLQLVEILESIASSRAELTGSQIK